MPAEIKEQLLLTLRSSIDPLDLFYKNTLESSMTKPIRVTAIHNTDIENDHRNFMFDPVLENFVIGAGGRLSRWNLEKNTKTPLVMRGLASDSQNAIKYCQLHGIDFYNIDTGYIQPSTRKDYHRVTKNNLQNLSAIKDCPVDRLKKLNWNYREPHNDGKILICPPSEKVMKFYDVNLKEWLESTVDQIKSQTNRTIEIRNKPNRLDRVTTDTIWKALDDTYCLVTYNSIAATEAILYSVPAITLAPNAAATICNTDINSINNPTIPTKDEIVRFAAHLSYCQFTMAEIKSGTAWSIVNESS